MRVDIAAKQIRERILEFERMQLGEFTNDDGQTCFAGVAVKSSLHADEGSWCKRPNMPPCHEGDRCENCQWQFARPECRSVLTPDMRCGDD